MYEAYWDLKEKPFRNTSNPKFFYMSPQHEEAMARLKYGITEHLGCVMLSGIFGCGKTIMLKTLFSQFRKGNYQVAFIFNPQMDAISLLKEIAYQMGMKENIPSNKAELLQTIDKITTNNYNDGKDTVVIIDEAHSIDSSEVFEELRMLLNFQKEDKFLVSLILSGQSELVEKINNIKQLAQRVGIRAHLDRLKSEETNSYIDYRLKVAGSENHIFEDEAKEFIFNNSGGIPRRINSICDLSLLSGFNKKVHSIDAQIVEETLDIII